MKSTALVLASLFVSLGLTACANKSNNTHPDADIRTRVYSPDRSEFVECEGKDGCPDDIIAMMGTMKPPTQADLDEVRRQHIYELEHPKNYGCDLPTVPRESFTIRDGGPSDDLPGDTFLEDTPAHTWSTYEKATRPQIKDDDKPIGIYQQGNDLTFVYRLQETGELVTCGRWHGKGIPDTCDLKYRVPKELCSYTHTILVGH